MTVHRDSAAAPTRWARNVLACELGSATSVSICSLRPHRTPLWGVFAGGHRATDERCVLFWGKCHSLCPPRTRPSAKLADGPAAAIRNSNGTSDPWHAPQWATSQNGRRARPYDVGGQTERWRAHCCHVLPRVSEAQSTRRVHGVLRHVLANESALFQSLPNHANTFRPNPADRAIPHTKDLPAETGSFGAFKSNTFTCARFFFISRARERVWKAICRLRLLAFAEVIGRKGSSRLQHSDQEMGDPSVLKRRLLVAATYELSLCRCNTRQPEGASGLAGHASRPLPDLTINFWHSVFVRAVKKDGATSRVFWRTYVHSGAESRPRRPPCRLGLSTRSL